MSGEIPTPPGEPQNSAADFDKIADSLGVPSLTLFDDLDFLKTQVESFSDTFKTIEIRNPAIGGAQAVFNAHQQWLKTKPYGDHQNEALTAILLRRFKCSWLFVESVLATDNLNRAGEDELTAAYTAWRSEPLGERIIEMRAYLESEAVEYIDDLFFDTDLHSNIISRLLNTTMYGSKQPDGAQPLYDGQSDAERAETWEGVVAAFFTYRDHASISDETYQQRQQATREKAKQQQAQAQEERRKHAQAERRNVQRKLLMRAAGVGLLFLAFHPTSNTFEAVDAWDNNLAKRPSTEAALLSADSPEETSQAKQAFIANEQAITRAPLTVANEAKGAVCLAIGGISLTWISRKKPTPKP